MEGYFNSLYDSISNALYQNSKSNMVNIITKANFDLVCRYFTKARIDQVYSSLTGRKANYRIGIPRGVAMPKALADVINGIGPQLGQSGALKFI